MSLRVVPITLKEANAFIALHHRHSRPVVGAKFQIGVCDATGTLRGVAVVGRPVSRILDDGVAAEITRVCTDGERNACSMLFAASRMAAKHMGMFPIYTYTLAEEGGASLRAAGFIVDNQNAGAPASRWGNRQGRSTDPVGNDLVGGKIRWIA